MCCNELQVTLEAPENNICFSNSSAAKENGKKFSFDNRTNKTICRVKVDGCLIINNDVKKCDYLFRICEDMKYYLVELKGLNIENGIEQIVSTYEIVNKKIKSIPDNYSGIIVSSSVPFATEQKFRKLQEKCYRERKLMIRKTHIQHIEIIQDKNKKS